MDSDDEIGIDSGNQSEEEDNYDFMEVDAQRSTNPQNDLIEYPFEVLTTDEIVQHMLDCIKEVTNVVEVRHNPTENQSQEYSFQVHI
jgi:ariadne-1